MTLSPDTLGRSLAPLPRRLVLPSRGEIYQLCVQYIFYGPVDYDRYDSPESGHSTRIDLTNFFGAVNGRVNDRLFSMKIVND
jgi:hypothetical protein